MTTQTKGWRVYAGTKKARARTEFDLAWRAISRLFAVRSAADQFATLAQRQMPRRA